MRTERAAVATAVAVVVITTLASGPLVGAVDLTGDERFDASAIGSGQATVTDVTFPDGATIEAGGFGTDAYYLRVPPANAVVTNVSGRPMLTYGIAIEELGFTRSSVHFVGERQAEAIELTISDEAFEPERITRSHYDATLTAVLRYDGVDRTVGARNVTVEVVE
jgi:hypothetical protein